MKRYILFLLSIFIISYTSAQTDTQNWVKEKIYRTASTSPITNPSISRTFINMKYYDGLGRIDQEMQWAMSPNGKNIIIHHEYDEFGRETKNFLPAPVKTTSLDYTYSAGNLTENYYSHAYNSRVAYAETLLESSPLQRKLKDAAPGDPWKLGSGHEIKYGYDINTPGDKVRLFKVEITYDSRKDHYIPKLIEKGAYAPGSLYKFTTVDENHSLHDKTKMIEFKDKEGKIILKRQVTQKGNADTYYVYDNYGNLTYVIPPLASKQSVITSTILDNLCYQYVYDHRNRIVAKHLPGARWIYMAYDKLDRLRATGPVKSPFNDRTEGWLMTKYDKFDRPIMTLFKKATIYSTSRKQLQDNIDHAKMLSEIANSGSTINGQRIYYTNDSYPTGGFEVLTVNYYDDYRFSPISIPTYVFSQHVRKDQSFKNTMGLPTGEWVRILRSTTNREGYTQLHYYKNDALAKEISKEIYLKDFKGGYHKEKMRYDFEGKLLQKNIYHKIPPFDSEEIQTADLFYYSSRGRLLKQVHKLIRPSYAAMDYHTISRVVYDELGKIKIKYLNNERIKQTFKYNIRGWLLNSESEYFSYELKYNRPSTGHPLYNGNISEMIWRSGTDNIERKYDYYYDGMNRLLEAMYDDERNNRGLYDVTLGYDLQGNILYLKRYGYKDKPIDNLTYRYYKYSNKLQAVKDYTENPEGFNNNYVNETSEYFYDKDGNLIKDLNKGISKISYNHMNLVTGVDIGQNHIGFTYDALGNKWFKKVTKDGKSWGTAYLFGFQYEFDFAGGVQHGWRLMFIPTAEGYLSAVYDEGVNTKPKFAYVTNLRDHLGNLRVSLTFDKEGKALILQEHHYYPFGLRHKGYGLPPAQIRYDADRDKIFTVRNVAGRYKYWYQEQERQTDLDLNWDSFKYRNYDYAIGRFMSIDPLAEKYPYNSTYAFSENRVIDARELEGMEKWILNNTEEIGPQLSDEEPLEIHGPYKNKEIAYEVYAEKNGIKLDPVTINVPSNNIKQIFKNMKELADNLSSVNNGFSALNFLIKNEKIGNFSKILGYETATLSIAFDYMSNDNTSEFVNNTIQTSLTTFIGNKQPIIGLGVGLILEDSRNPNGLTNLKNGRLAKAYKANYNQTQTYFKAHFYNPEVYNNTPKLSDLFDTISNRFNRWIKKHAN